MISVKITIVLSYSQHSANIRKIINSFIGSIIRVKLQG